MGKRRERQSLLDWRAVRTVRLESHPNVTERCRWCEADTEHTVSDFCGRRIRICTMCGEMRHAVADTWPRIKTPEELAAHKAELAKRVEEIKRENAAKSGLPEMPTYSAAPSLMEPDLYEPNDVVPEFGRWQIVRLCHSCNGMTVHVRSLQKVSHGYVFRCGDCGRIVSAGMR